MVRFENGNIIKSGESIDEKKARTDEAECGRVVFSKQRYSHVALETSQSIFSVRIKNEGFLPATWKFVDLHEALVVDETSAILDKTDSASIFFKFDPAKLNDTQLQAGFFDTYLNIRTEQLFPQFNEKTKRRLQPPTYPLPLESRQYLCSQ